MKTLAIRSLSMVVCLTAALPAASADEACMDRFLRESLGEQQTALLQQTWRADYDTENWAQAFYGQHGRNSIDDAVAGFMRVRHQLHASCRGLPDLQLD
jgi:hypothetical protein